MGNCEYRCSVAVYVFACQGRKVREDAGDCQTSGDGRIVRVPLDTDLRIFTPTLRRSLAWQTALSRALGTGEDQHPALYDRHFEFEHQHIRGLERMKTCVTLAHAVLRP